MPTKGPMTESMLYVLMALLKQERCGMEMTAFIEQKTMGRVKLGPGTLYTILARFEEEKWICETKTEGRKRTYCLTGKGRAAYETEVARLKLCLADAESEGWT